MSSDIRQVRSSDRGLLSSSLFGFEDQESRSRIKKSTQHRGGRSRWPALDLDDIGEKILDLGSDHL